jgi:hypothetical protein
VRERVELTALRRELGVDQVLADEVAVGPVGVCAGQAECLEAFPQTGRA